MALTLTPARQAAGMIRGFQRSKGTRQCVDEAGGRERLPGSFARIRPIRDCGGARTNQAWRNDDIPSRFQATPDRSQDGERRSVDPKRTRSAVRGRKRFGGARRNRTADLLNAIQALSQLSYGPTRDDRLGDRSPTGFWYRLGGSVRAALAATKRSIGGSGGRHKRLMSLCRHLFSRRRISCPRRPRCRHRSGRRRRRRLPHPLRGRCRPRRHRRRPRPRYRPHW